MLVRLLYASRCKSVTTEMIDAILAKSRTRNPGLGITGILCHSGDSFIQVLEGGRDVVNRLFLKIAIDPRHDDVQLLHFEEITERRFAGWTMGQVNVSRINASVLLKYSERPVLDPFSVSGCVSMSLLLELMASAAIVGRAN
jgi:hypothetical protein